MPLPLLALVLICAAACGDARPAAAGPVTATDSVALRPSDPELRAAADAINAGHPYRASQLLVPVLRDSTRRTPEAVYLAAAAAAAWSGWGEVERLVGDVPWADSLFGGAARVLAVRAALAQRRDSVALSRAAGAVQAARGTRSGDDASSTSPARSTGWSSATAQARPTHAPPGSCRRRRTGCSCARPA